MDTRRLRKGRERDSRYESLKGPGRRGLPAVRRLRSPAPHFQDALPVHVLYLVKNIVQNMTSPLPQRPSIQITANKAGNII